MPKDTGRQALRGFTAAMPLGSASLSPHGVARHRAESPSLRLLAGGYDGRAPGAGAITSAHAEHSDPGRLGSAAVAVQRPELMSSSASRSPDDPLSCSGVESMVGMFINVLPLRVAVNEDSDLSRGFASCRRPWSSCGDSRRSRSRGSKRWSDVPPGMPLFESIVIVQNLPFVALPARTRQTAGYRVGSIRGADPLSAHRHRPFRAPSWRSRSASTRGDFDAGTIERTLGHLRTVLEAMAVDPERRLVDLPLMTESEQEQLIGRWTASDSEAGLQ